MCEIQSLAKMMIQNQKRPGDLSACVTEISGRCWTLPKLKDKEFAHNIILLKKRQSQLVAGLQHGRKKGRQNIVKTPHGKTYVSLPSAHYTLLLSQNDSQNREVMCPHRIKRVQRKNCIFLFSIKFNYQILG